MASHPRPLLPGFSQCKRRCPEDPFRSTTSRTTMRLRFLCSWGGVLLWPSLMSNARIATFPFALTSGSCLACPGATTFYVDLALPFGFRSAPFIFNSVADVVQWIVKVKYGVRFPIVAAHVWGAWWQRWQVEFLCDNSAVVAIVNSASSRDKFCMHLLRRLVFVACQFHFSVSARHVPGRHNSAADSLSCSRFQEFRRLRPSEEAWPVPRAGTTALGLELRRFGRSVCCSRCVLRLTRLVTCLRLMWSSSVANPCLVCAFGLKSPNGPPSGWSVHLHWANWESSLSGRCPAGLSRST